MKTKRSEKGSALMLVVIIVLILVSISFAFMSISWMNSKRAFQDESASKALYLAESAAAVYINNLNASGSAPVAITVPLPIENGSYWVPAENLVDFSQAGVVGANNTDPDYTAFQVAAKVNKVTRRINVLMTHKAGGVFWNAIFAGNSSNSAYSLGLDGGKDSNGNNVGDSVYGNVYSGGNVTVGQNAGVYDMNGNANGATITETGSGSSSSSKTSPTFKNGTEPSLDIPRTFSYTDPNTGITKTGLSEAEYNALKLGSTSGHRDASTGVAWVDVAGENAKNGVTNKWVDGSTGTDILDPNNPAHIFRKDPSSTSGSANNRTQTYEYTAPSAKSDFYLEDPTSKNVTQTMLDGGQHPVNGDTTASMVNVNSGGNNAVYFIDGNMRVSGEPIKSYQLNPDASVNGGLKMSIVVKGNVSLTDNLLYPQWQSQKDAVAIIAIADPAFPNTTGADFINSSANLPAAFKNKTGKSTVNDFVTDYNTRASKARGNGLNMPNLDLSTADGQAKASQEYNKVYGSGNVFFGDPGSGTVEHFEAYMYAENNFYATNLDSTKSSGGTQKMEIFGNMTAGNQVNINRSATSVGYIPLSVTFDPAIMVGSGPPGLPSTPSLAGQDWHILSWKQSVKTDETAATTALNEK